MFAAMTGRQHNLVQIGFEADALGRHGRDSQLHAGMNAFGDQLRVDRGGLVLHVNHLDLFAGREVRQRPAGSRRQVAFLGRDRVTVRVERRMAQPHRQLLGLFG